MRESSWRRWSHVFRRDPATEVDEELEYHVEQRIRDYIARGMDPDTARRAAHERLGDLGGVRAECANLLAADEKSQKRRASLSVSWLDVRLGIRMFWKYPGLSLVSVIGMSIAIAIGAGGFGLINAVVDSPLPLDEGDRVIAIQNSDAENPGSPNRHALHDFMLWREEVRSVTDLSAFTTVRVSLDIPDGEGGDVRIARMTASGFRVARIAPALGRPLLDADEREGAPHVLVIAHEEWMRRFQGDAAVIGKSVRLDATMYTIVGVMPPGFRFPLDERYWVPLQLASAYEIGAGPEVHIFGRLVAGATLEQAQAELTTIGQRMAEWHPATHAHLRPWVRPYTHPFSGIDSPARAWLIRSIQFGLSLLLVVVSVNVAILVYARTAARTSEIAVRTALGASRMRIVTQLFAEALVLSMVAAVVGLAIAGVGLDLIAELVSAEGVPFWVRLGFSPATTVYAVCLAVAGAAIVGVVPALKTTGRSVLGRTSSASSQLALGRVWTTLVVIQVAVCVAILPYAIYGTSRLGRSAAARSDYAIGEFARAWISTRTPDLAGQPTGNTPAIDSAAFATAARVRFASDVSEIMHQFAAIPEVAGATFASSYPGYEAYRRRIEVENVSGRSAHAWINHVDVNLFDVFDVPITAGRKFVATDVAQDANVVIVDRAFADEMFGSGSVLGRRVRESIVRSDGSGFVDRGPWLEIIGIVPAFTPPPPFERVAPKLYYPLALAEVDEAVQLAVRLQAGVAPTAFLGRLRESARSAGPAVSADFQAVEAADRLLRKAILSLALAIVAATASVLMLSAAGIYAMMSFAVNSRRREIGIRTALGATPRLVLSGVFRRAITQLGVGAVVGILLAEALPRVQGGSFFAGEGIYMLFVVAGIVMLIGLIASFEPARRGLAVQPSEALRSD